MATPWRRHKAILPKPGRFGSARRLGPVHHVTHLDGALRVLGEGRVAATSMPVDEPALAGFGGRAVWLAPNSWADGSRYGTIQLSFEFETLVEGRRIYWVLDADEGRCLFLVARRKPAGLRVRRYHPERAKGPLRMVGGVWWWNPDVSLQVMMDEDIPLGDCVGLDFVRHHPSMCSVGAATACREARDEGDSAASRFLAAALSPGCLLPAAALVMGGRTTPAVQRAAFAVRDALGAQDGDLSGPVKRKEDVDALLASALAQLASGDRDGAERTAALVAGGQRIERALIRLIAARADLGTPASGRVPHPRDTVSRGRARAAGEPVGPRRAPRVALAERP